MTWTSYLSSIEKEKDHIVFRIVYSDGVSQKFEQRNDTTNLTDDLIKQTARNTIARLEAAETMSANVTMKVGEAIDLTPPVVKEPAIDPVQIARDEWFAQFRQLQSLQRAVSAGLIDPADKRISTLQDSLKAAWSDDYLGMV